MNRPCGKHILTACEPETTARGTLIFADRITWVHVSRFRWSSSAMLVFVMAQASLLFETAQAQDVVLGKQQSLRRLKPHAWQAAEPLAIPAEIPDGYSIIDGDILVPENFFQTGGAYGANRWPNGRVPDEFDAGVTQDHRTIAHEAMAHWQTRADVGFVPRTDSDSVFLRIKQCGSNYAPTGMPLLPADICIHEWDIPIVAHERGHALSLWHQHSRHDRDTYIRINI